MAPQVTVKVNCVLSWKLLSEYDNSHNRAATTFNVEISKSRNISGQDYTKHIRELSHQEANRRNLGIVANANWKVVSASLAPSVEASKILQDFVSTSAKAKREGQVREERKDTQSFSVGPGEKLYFYQQHLSGPGLDFDIPTTAAVSSKKTSADNKSVVIDVVAAPVVYIKETDVIYGTSSSEAPETRVHEWFDQGDDINEGFGGSYVWLVPVYTLDPDEAATSFNIIIQSNPVEGWKDLAKGAGGSYRYIRAAQDSSVSNKAIDLALVRTEDAAPARDILARLGPNWDGASRDINENRGGAYLYFAWQLS
ncbi:hypothetical protein K449DRAFT_403327 [Hypoxylon sp. EC38]|nr:hypothetical protein K449DRAFT_403327 [Hypoxylon sp. EC38]